MTNAKTNVYAELERKLGEKLPGGIQKILESTGFENKSSLLNINIDSIKDIEEYINENKYILEKTSYELCLNNNYVFKVKPGHRAFILNIPKVLNSSKKKIESVLKKNNRQKNVFNTCRSNICMTQSLKKL